MSASVLGITPDRCADRANRWVWVQRDFDGVGNHGRYFSRLPVLVIAAFGHSEMHQPRLLLQLAPAILAGLRNGAARACDSKVTKENLAARCPRKAKPFL